MARLLTGLTITLMIIGTALVTLGAYQPPGKPYPAGSDRDDPQAVLPAGLYGDNMVIHDQVSLCNLVNALWLEKEQLQSIIEILEPRMTELDALAAEAKTNHDSKEYGRAMSELHRTLLRGEEADEELRHRVNSLSGAGRGLHLEYESQRREIAAEIMPLLTENQLFILGSYKKCLFNQDNPLHPERVGQASAAGRIVEMLDKLRQAPESSRERFIDRGVRRLAERAYQDTPFAIDQAEEETRLRGLIDKALAMEDEQFAMEAATLAAEMSIYLDTKDQLIEDHYNLPTGLRDHKLNKLASNFVVPGALEIFQAQLDSLTAE